MPGGSKRRSDALELEELSGGARHGQRDRDDDDNDQSLTAKMPGPSSSLQQAPLSPVVNPSSSVTVQQSSNSGPLTPLRQSTDGESDPKRQRRWFHFGRTSKRPTSLAIPSVNSATSATKATTSTTTTTTTTINKNTASRKVANAIPDFKVSATAKASLARPEATTIANSTSTITTPLPPPSLHIESPSPRDIVAEAAAALLQPQPQSSAPPPHAHASSVRKNAKKRRSKTEGDSLQGLGEREHPKSEPNVNMTNGSSGQRDTVKGNDTLWQSANALHPPSSSGNLMLAPSGPESLPPPTTPAMYCEEPMRDNALLTADRDLHDHEDITDSVGSRLAGSDGGSGDDGGGGGNDFRSSLRSLWSKFTVWKSSSCRRHRSRSHSSRGTASGVDDISGATSLAGIEGGGGKGLNVSSDSEQFPLPPTAGPGLFASTSRGIRRLSQIRRRRSSYYFSDNERRIRANDREFNSQFKYADNYIKTSKYSLLTFLPFNLLEQFQRLANFYFLCLLVLQLIPAISSLTPVTTAIPLIGVLTLTAVKDAYDDIQRHISDSQVNNRRSKALRNGKLVDEKWSGVQVGDVIRLENNQFVAADILLLTTSEPNGLCFIETAELDGETNLKCKQCLPETTEMGQRHDLLWNFNGEIICERPNNLLNKFEGTLMWRNQRFALDNEKVLLRGCVLRNTQWCYGMVIFAGKDTKLMQNSGKTQFKSTGVDRLLNMIIIGIVLFLLSICAFFAVACAIWEGLIGQHFQVYLPWENIIPKDVAQGATVIGFLVFFSYAIVLNTVVPISLYVSVEVIRFAQSFLINWDDEMYYDKTGTNAKARTTTLNEELGQIQYIFSDKTGTLTQNIMTFNKCSINGRTYGDVIDLRTGEVVEVTDALESVDFSSNPEYEPDFRWYDRTLLDAVRSDEEHAHTFFRLLALCHTVMPEYVEDGRLEYQAQSPDESALVSAARNFGFVFRSRTPNSITIEVMGRTEEYELLSILDFNNVRKRMSVILRRGNNIVLYCKGADSVIYDRLSSSQNDIKARTQEHLNKFAGEGLRTLVLAERRLDEAFYNAWSERHMEASVSMDHREDRLAEVYEEIESELELVGVTAIEDKLQDGVPQTIANLQTAGIKIWVLTGDKQETAINIGYSCQLLTDELVDVFIVDGSTMEEVEKQLRQFRESIRIVNRFRPAPLEPSVNLHQNGSNQDRRYSNSLMMTGNPAFRAQVSPPPPPAISVVTFRWDDDDNIKRNKGEPDSAECSEFYDNLEKGNGSSATIRDDESIEENTGFAIVINGHSLVHCLSPELETKFLDVASQCKAVICCRVTPLQKALVVELIKRSKNAVTLAIGDGANDVSMIKAAHIGVGISGQEGLQAVLASDYSIAQFRYLERLLLVHGRWSYYRMCKFLRYFFYKNFAFTLCHCWYSFFCGFSAQTVFDPMFISVYNLFYTSLPVLALGIFEQDVSDKLSLDYPKLYTPGLKSQLFNTKEFVYSVLHGAFSSLILFLIPYGTYKEGVSPNGLILSDHMTLGAVVASILIIDNTAQIALYTSYWTIFNHIMIWGSLIWYFVLDYFYNYVIGGPYVGSLTQAMKDLTFWATMFITVTVIMAPVLAYKYYLLDVHPSLSDKIRVKRREANLRSRQTSQVTRTPSSRRARRSLRSGYAFAHQEGFGRLITSGKIMRKLPQEFAFPLGLGSRKGQSTSNPINNNNTRDNKNSSMADVSDFANSGYGNDNGNSNGNRNGGAANRCGTAAEEDLSPRAPCQDLDTINL